MRISAIHSDSLLIEVGGDHVRRCISFVDMWSGTLIGSLAPESTPHCGSAVVHRPLPFKAAPAKRHLGFPNVVAPALVSIFPVSKRTVLIQ